MDVFEALQKRRSVRAFLSAPVSRTQVRRILDAARRSPSGGNLQPWRVIAVAAAARDAVISMAKATLADHPPGEPTDRPIYPAKLWEPYRTRRFAAGEAMYAALDIPRGDKADRLAHLARNFEFFGAPCAFFFVIDARMGHGQWAHLGMFQLACALSAEAMGLATCFQESWALLRPSLADHFGLDDDHMVTSAMAFGHADPDAPVNALRTEREEVDDFTVFRGFEEDS